MGSHTTLRITRAKALEIYVLEILGLDITDDDLELAMDKYLDDRLYNCRIVDDDDENDDEVIL